MPDIENAKWVTVKQLKTSRKKTAKTPEKQSKQLFLRVSAVFPAVFRLFYCDPLGTLFGCFLAVFNVGHLAPL